jgi:PadR family transcriptional regulator AphA
MGAAAPHGLKYAVLGLVIERKSYAYRLAQRYEELLGDAYDLHPSAIYTALDQLERAGLVEADTDTCPGATRRSPRVLYAATATGREVFQRWITTPPTRPEPIRSELVRKLALSEPRHGEELLAMIEAAELECLDKIEAATLRMQEVVGGDSWDVATSRLVHQYGIRQLHARLEWLRDAHAVVRRLVDDGPAAPV